jgi:hypothetical protein
MNTTSINGIFNNLLIYVYIVCYVLLHLTTAVNSNTELAFLFVQQYEQYQILKLAKYINTIK